MDQRKMFALWAQADYARMIALGKQDILDRYEALDEAFEQFLRLVNSECHKAFEQERGNG